MASSLRWVYQVAGCFNPG